ncbi:hypothetical protein RCH06_002689 [Polaromonas sp. CG_9.5]|uniref:DUF1631 family protein n=1 Tax=Polaromonas sp. CG_9.5 TaxID=3071705 RepID=UPI002E0BD0A7|nr:hypothetical protein [Polaromonas sp. CG_9.5]
MALPPRDLKHSLIAGQARALFTERAVRMLPVLAAAIGDSLLELAARTGNAREMQERRDALQAYQKNSAIWAQGTQRAWSKRLPPAVAAARLSLADSGKLELLGDDTIEHRILASRLALRLLDFSSWELNDLRLRIQSLENVPELHRQDIFRPEVLAQGLIEQWVRAGLPQSVWLLVQEITQKSMAVQMHDIYHATNEFLIRQGVMPEIDLRPLVRRTPSAVSTNVPPSQTGLLEKTGSAKGETGNSQSADGGDTANGSPAGSAAIRGEDSAAQAGAISSVSGDGQDEARRQMADTPMARVRVRAQAVMGRLKQLLTRQVPGYDEAQMHQASPQLAQAMSRLQQAEESTADLPASVQGQMQSQTHEQPDVDQMLQALRQRTSTLKQSASTSAEKATIEIVALMFQSILTEDRIPPGIRVWFARLQMPVLRVAIAEPEFFSSLRHPARQLIDRMGSCVLGFDVTVTGSVMETEIRRVVQVIEQYPETGRRVFQLVYDEFDKFLSCFLAEQDGVAPMVSLAQQLEQKETMTIQYTIEMRTMLNDMSVREEIRDFLFKVWAEVLAVAAVKNGPQHVHTLQLKQAAADLVWAASAKPNRVDRIRVISTLPGQLQLLRQGMVMLGLNLAAQDAQVKIISDILADAFMSKTDAIPLEKVQAMAKRLTNLEDYLSDQDVGDLPLDADSLVMIGIDAANIEIIGDGGNEPTDAMRTWASALQPGSWFSLDHNGKVSHVQFSWCSERKQLHLFVAADGRSFLLQMRRLAAYLQAGLLVPTEEEALTVRATREALAKLDANPERLLSQD